MKQGARSKIYGFTLVELLIVVAIIGVLATIGVPTFRTMVQKAKKSEAKVGLGGLYTAETAFFSEYGTYGNVLDKIGFDLEGSANRIYSIGFTSATCNTAQSTTKFPLIGGTQGSALNIAFPGYYQGTQIGIYPNTSGGTSCPVSTLSIADFTAGAGGVIGNTTNFAQTDTWTIDRLRELKNIQDGIIK